MTNDAIRYGDVTIEDIEKFDDFIGDDDEMGNVLMSMSFWERLKGTIRGAKIRENDLKEKLARQQEHHLEARRSWKRDEEAVYEHLENALAAAEVKIARYRKAMNYAVTGIMLALQIREDIEARSALEELSSALSDLDGTTNDIL